MVERILPFPNFEKGAKFCQALVQSNTFKKMYFIKTDHILGDVQE